MHGAHHRRRALDRFAIVDRRWPPDVRRRPVPGLRRGLRARLSQGDPEAAYERAMIGGDPRPYASTSGRGAHPASSCRSSSTTTSRRPSRASPRPRMRSPRRWVDSSPGSRRRVPSTRARAKARAVSARRAADQLPRAMVLGTLLRPAGGPVETRVSGSIRPMSWMRRCASTASTRACSGSRMASARSPWARRRQPRGPGGLVGGHHGSTQGRLLARARGRLGVPRADRPMIREPDEPAPIEG